MPKPVESPKGNPAKIQEATFERTVYVLKADQGHTLEDMLRIDYWSLVSARLRPWDMVEVRAADGSYFALFLVLACDRAWAKVHPLITAPLTSQDVSATQAALAAQPVLKKSEDQAAKQASQTEPTHMVQWKGGARKHCVIRIADGAVIKEGIQTKNEAMRALEDHLALAGA